MVGETRGGGDPDGYYDDAIGKTGSQLEAALHDIIATGDTPISYDAVWNALKVTDQDPANSGNVIALYSGFSMAKANRRRRRPVEPRARLGAVPRRLRHLHGSRHRPPPPAARGRHRQLRARQPRLRQRRHPDSEAPGNYADSNSWEPRDAVKGDVARMVFYMSVRYEGDDGFPDLEANDVAGNGSAPRLGRLSVLLQWNAEDPPDAFEMRRNDVIYETYQHNRNPFIDHPEWADAIW